MKPLRWLLVCLTAVAALSVSPPRASAYLFNRIFRPGWELEQVNTTIKGKVLDFTYNHGTDHRIWSAALGEKRDLYVYVPPNYDPSKMYPLIVYLHGFGQDEHNFLHIVEKFDEAICTGQCPPVIIAAPDGSIKGKPSLLNAGSFYVNSDAGRFEDYIMQDVWQFLHCKFSIRPEREAHAFVGASMGGFGAYNLGIKYRDNVANLVAIFPPLNPRYLDCHGRFFGKFDPNCFQFRTHLEPWAPVARFYGVIVVRQRRMIDPLYGRSPDALDRIARENPAEMLATYDVRPGMYEMFIGYVGEDEFNIDSQIQSFLHLAGQRGIYPTVRYIPDGHHNERTGIKFLPDIICFLAPRLAPYAPPR